LTKYYIHPFREGNGRTLRIFFSQLAENAGYSLDWRAVNKEKHIEAARASFIGELKPLEAIFQSITSEESREIGKEKNGIEISR
jgi:cell filamentation protein